jgi:hypothetical protein
MAFRVISGAKDKLPFKVAVKCLAKGRLDHAYILKLGTGDEELGTFVITNNTPEAVKDTTGYHEGRHKGLRNLKLDEIQALVTWASRKNSLYPGTNW